MGAPIGRLLGAGLSFSLAVGNVLGAHASSPASAIISRSDVTPGLGHAVKLRRSDPDRQMTVAVSLALRNQASLDAFIAKVSSPGSRHRGRFLTPAEFVADYGPTDAEVQAVGDYLRASGLSVSGISPNRTIIDATGPVHAVEAAFGAAIYDWHDRDRNRDFFGNDSQPLLPAGIAPSVVDIAGLNNHYSQRHASLQPLVTAPSASGQAGGFTPSDIRSAYDVTALETIVVPGSGQPLGLFELDAFNQADITTYDSTYTLATVPPKVVPVDSGPTSQPGGQTEVELDIELVHALAPASPITVWEGPNTGSGILDTYNKMVVSDSTPSNSTSWGICEPNTDAADVAALDNIFKQAAAQGQSFYAASGDEGAYDCAGSSTNSSSGLAVDNPADDPYVTGVGGTSLSLNASGGYGSEGVWSNTSKTPNQGSGGGLSTYFLEPAWQAGPGVANPYSNGKRQVPDVALDADPRTGYSIYTAAPTCGGLPACWAAYGGTSASAPSWAAVTALVNRYSVSHGGSNLGFANPTLYRLGSTAAPFPPFHDITSGNNLYYPATAGWDFATGWGSFDAYNVAQDLPPAAVPPRLTSAISRVRSDTSPPPAVPAASARPRLGLPGPTATTAQTSQAGQPSSIGDTSAVFLGPISQNVLALMRWLTPM